MTVITEAELREMWQGGRGTIPPLAGDIRFTPSARDFINHWNIEISYLDEVTPEATAASDRVPPAWDKPGAFPGDPVHPVHIEGDPPVCPVCGQSIADKPDHTASRFLFGGKMDTLNAQFLLATAQAKRFNLPELAGYLKALAAYCREISDAEDNRRPVAPLQLAGLNETKSQERTHWPRRTVGLDQLEPGPDDHEMVLRLNLLRCQVREAEPAAANVFAATDGPPTRSDLIPALNRLASALNYLILLFKAGKFAWKMPGRLE